MEKVVCLLFDEADRAGDELREVLRDKAVPALRAAGASRITLHVQDGDVAAGRPLRRSDPPIRAMVSFWLADSDDWGPCEQALAPLVRRLAAYLVVESRPMDHGPPIGERTPGMCQVTCIAKLADLDYDEFTRIWHEDHKRVAIETQSTTGYVRNEIVRPLSDGAPEAWIAIVEETFPIAALDDPKVFYAAADDDDLRDRMQRMVTSCNRFLDMEPLEFTHMSEYSLG